MASVSFYNFSKRKNSTAIPSGSGTSHTVRLKDNTSLYKPVFELSGGNYPTYTYAKWQGLYFYVTDITSTGNNLYEVECALDPIGSARSDIFNLNTFVSRTTFATYQNKYYCDPEVSILPYIVDVDQGSTSTGIFDTDGAYILRVVGLQGIDTFILKYSEIEEVLNWMYTDTTDYLDGVNDSVVKAVVNPFQYIVSFKYTPIKHSILTSAQTGAFNRDLYYGFWHCQVLDQGVIKKYPKAYYTGFHVTNFTLNKPNVYYNDFGDLDPNITKAHIVLPGGAVYEIPVDWLDLTLQCEIGFDVITGNAQYLITDGGSHVLANFASQLAFDVQIGQSAADLKGIASGVMTAVAGIAVGGAAAVAGSVAGGVGALSAAMQPNPSVNGQAQTATFIKSQPNIKIIASRRGTSVTPGNIGKPCNQNLTLSTLTGYYARCPQAAVSTNLPDEYKDMINTTLADGIWLD